MRRIVSTVLVATLILLGSGCDGAGEKGKNKDRDTPKPAKVE